MPRLVVVGEVRTKARTYLKINDNSRSKLPVDNLSMNLKSGG